MKILQILIKVNGITIIINTLLYNMIKLKAISRINTLSDDDVDYADMDDNDNGDNDDIYMYVSSDDLTWTETMATYPQLYNLRGIYQLYE